MASVSGNADSFSCPNYVGELFMVGKKKTSFLNMAGGLSGGGKKTKSFEFAMASPYSLDAGSQPSVDETTSMTVSSYRHYPRGQDVNTCQIFQEAVSVSYKKQSQTALISGLSVQDPAQQVNDELDFQIQASLQQVAVDVDWTFLNGTYHQAASAADAAQTGGIISGCSTNTLDASGAELSSALINQLLRTMADNAVFEQPVIWVNAFQKQKISEIYGYQLPSGTVGGVNIVTLVTDFGEISVAWDQHMPTTSLLIAEMSVIFPVFCEVPTKGFLFYEMLAKTGASESGQVYGQIGIDYGAEEYHGVITNLKDS